MTADDEAPVPCEVGDRRPGKKAFVGTFLTSIGVQGATILTGILMARILGPEGRGLYAAGLLWPSVFAGLGIFGVNQAMTLRAAKYPNDVGGLYATALMLGGALSVLTTFIAFLAISAIMADKPDVVAAAVVFLPYIPVFIVTSLLNSTDIGLGSFRHYNEMRGILTAVNVGTVAVLFIAGNGDPQTYLMALLAANGAALVYKLGRLPWRQIRPTTRHMAVLVAGAGFYLATIALLARDQIERMFLVTFVDVDILGLYVVALSAAMMPSVLAKSLGLIVFARSAVIGGVDALVDTARLFRQLTLLNLVMSIGSAIVLPILIPIFYGDAFSAARPVAIVLVFAQLLIAMGSVLDEGMRGQGKPQYGMIALGIMVAVFLAMATMLLPWLGTVGVALAAASGHLSALIAFVVFFKRLAPTSRLFPVAQDVIGLGHELAAVLTRLPIPRFANGGWRR